MHPGDLATAGGLLASFAAQLHEAGIGTISEIFDAPEPCGCIAQAWSVAEVLRCLVKTAAAKEDGAAEAAPSGAG